MVNESKIVSIRDAIACMLQLCDYIDDACSLTDIQTLKDKARQVREVLIEKGPKA